MIAWAIAECLRPGGHYREQALIIDIEGESGEASGDPPSLWRGYGVTCGNWWKVEKIWNLRKFACGIKIWIIEGYRKFYET
jgi:hypothetical protein